MHLYSGLCASSGVTSALTSAGHSGDGGAGPSPAVTAGATPFDARGLASVEADRPLPVGGGVDGAFGGAVDLTPAAVTGFILDADVDGVSAEDEGGLDRLVEKLTLPSILPPFSTTIEPKVTSPFSLPVEQI